MKKFAIRKTETVKTTAAFYGGTCCPTPHSAHHLRLSSQDAHPHHTAASCGRVVC